ncbi:hypothetical protein Tco_1557034 [Tanacetum coccineum]
MVKGAHNEAFACRCAEGDVVLRQSYKPESCGKLFYACPKSKPPKHYWMMEFFLWKGDLDLRELMSSPGSSNDYQEVVCCRIYSGGGVAGSGACRLSNGCGDGRNASSRLKSGSPGLALLPKCAIGEEGVRLWAEAGNGCHNGVIINY